jgi:hypothetical protein
MAHEVRSRKSSLTGRSLDVGNPRTRSTVFELYSPKKRVSDCMKELNITYSRSEYASGG